jgi:muramoyltetrapeptide carboxypeptidase
MTTTRRAFLGTTAGAAIGTALAGTRTSAAAAPTKPPRLKPGDTIGLIDPAGASFERGPMDIVVDTMAALGLKARLGPHLFDRYGYLAGTDKNRAEDVNTFFADPSVNAILAVRGGWGCARMLPYLDFATIATNPKILLGYSDLTALLLGIHARTGLVTFHGPVGISKWTPFNVEHVRRVLFAGEAVTYENVKETGEFLVPVENRITTITPGVARGRLAGGNLSVLVPLIGSRYALAIDTRDKWLAIEDVNEAADPMDRMMAALKLSGHFEQVEGIILGDLHDKDTDLRDAAFQMLKHHLPRGRRVPIVRLDNFGHIWPIAPLPMHRDVTLRRLPGSDKRVRIEIPWETWND